MGKRYEKILSFFTTERLYALYAQYAEGDYLSELLEKFESSLVTYLARFDWPEALAFAAGAVDGRDQSVFAFLNANNASVT